MGGWAHNKNIRPMIEEVKRSSNMGKISALCSEVVIFADGCSIKRELVTVRRLDVSVIGETVNRGLYV